MKMNANFVRNICIFFSNLQGQKSEIRCREVLVLKNSCKLAINHIEARVDSKLAVKSRGDYSRLLLKGKAVQRFVYLDGYNWATGASRFSAKHGRINSRWWVDRRSGDW